MLATTSRSTLESRTLRAALGVLTAAALLALALPLSSQRARNSVTGCAPVPLETPGSVLAQREVQDLSSPFPSTIGQQDSFGAGVARLGDLDGDGVEDLAIAAPDDDQGALWILFLAADGSVRSHRKHGRAEGYLSGRLSDGDQFGSACASLGDLDGDGVVELAVGVPGHTGGRVWILSLCRDGGVKSHREIGASLGGLVRFGASLAPLGDFDGDGVVDLAVGDPLDVQDGPFFGALWILFLRSDGSVKSQRKISASQGGFSGVLDVNDQLGTSVVSLGDRDGDGIGDLALGAPGDDDANGDAGAVWILFLNANGSVKAQHKITTGQSGFTAGLAAESRFGGGACALGDLDGDGRPELVVGAPRSQSTFERPSLWVLFLDGSARARSQQEIGTGVGGFVGTVQLFSQLGAGLAPLGDRDGDGLPELLVGAPGEDAGRIRAGAVYVLELTAGGRVASQTRISAIDGLEVSVAPHARDRYGSAVVGLGDLDGDGLLELAVGAPGDSGSGVASQEGALWIHSLAPDGSVRRALRIGAGAAGFDADLDSASEFGSSVAPIGDLDGDGLVDLAVGSPRGTCPTNTGAVHVLFMERDGTVRENTAICGPEGGVPGSPSDSFGHALAPLSDLDGDGVPDLAVGAPGDDDGGTDAGALWVLLLRADGQAKSLRKISATRGGFGGVLQAGDSFGSSVARLGDLDGDGIPELAVGAPGDDDGLSDSGAVWILSLDPDGSLQGQRKISLTEGGFSGPLSSRAAFGTSVAALGDLDGSGVADLAVGAPGSGKGAVWILGLRADGTVRDQWRIAEFEGGFTGPLPAPTPGFGAGVAALGDRDGDGVMDLAVGTPNFASGSVQPFGSVWLLSLDGLATVDFEHGSDLLTPLRNGQAVSSPPEFRGPFALSGRGANLGPAVFDSTPRGPNDPSQDRDLLVDSGNVLLLQNSLVPTQTVPGIFDRPNDDPDGGTFRLAFATPVELRSLDLIDIDAGAVQAACVVMSDELGRARNFWIPPGWTGDRLVDPVRGIGTLDLRTLAPQPGFASTTSASESPGFDPRRVVSLEVRLGSSGALDNLHFDPRPDP